jgi:hypothetical protein
MAVAVNTLTTSIDSFMLAVYGLESDCEIV